MDEPPIPGSRVRATTKHGTLTVDEIAEIQPGMARLMDELGRRWATVYLAAKEGKWDLALYMQKESAMLLRTMALSRPKYREDLETFSKGFMDPVRQALEGRDWPRFEGAYDRSVKASDAYHAKYGKGFIHFRVPQDLSGSSWLG